jgi:uracil-DNA glycosylase
MSSEDARRQKNTTGGDAARRQKNTTGGDAARRQKITMGGDTARRQEMLREMGISPLWQLRATAQVEEQPDVMTEPADLAASSPPAPVAREPAAPEAPAVQVQAAVAAGSHEPARIAKMDWPDLKSSVATCTACGLYAKRNKTVFGVGDEHADWLFVGEGPGADEDAQGEPFVGQAGQLLDNMLAAIALQRGTNVYIANIVKCRPPGNRNPQQEEAQACSHYLQRQIELIQPKLIVALGKVAAVNLLGRDVSIASLRGQLHDYRNIPLIVTYHPAYLLRTLLDKVKAWEDLCFAVNTMQKLMH